MHVVLFDGVGLLLSVNPYIAARIAGLLSLNERVVYIGEWQHGFMSLAAIGATSVGSIQVYHDRVQFISVSGRVRMIPNKAPSIQYPIILASSDTSTQYQYRYYSVLCSIAMY